jgi:hypothetical protein
VAGDHDDESDLRTLFANAPGDPPPPAFDAGDVVAASRRVTARRRRVIAAACACVVLVLGGVGIIGSALTASPQSGTMMAKGSGGAERTNDLTAEGQPGDGPERHSGTTAPGFPTPSPQQGGAENGRNGPRADSTFGCDKVDRELATALAGELPVTVAAAPVPGHVCSTGIRSAGFPLSGGTVSVAVVPAGARAPATPPGVARAERPAASGGIVLVISTPEGPGAAPPFAADLGRIAAALAARY